MSGKRGGALACAVGVTLAWMAVADRAKADDGVVLETRHEDHGMTAQNFALEVRAALYNPQVDSDPTLKKGANPFATTFGSQTRFEGGLELDWQALRIPDVGTVGPGFGIGYYNISGLAPIAGTNTPSAETTTLEILPMYLVGVFRLDVLWRKAHIPIVPYGKAGLGLAFWRASNTVGTSESANNVVGEGHTWGTQLAAGLAFNIGVLDPNSVHQLDEATGINNSYLFVEFMAATLQGIAQTDPLYVGSNSLAFGATFEF